MNKSKLFSRIIALLLLVVSWQAYAQDETYYGGTLDDVTVPYEETARKFRQLLDVDMLLHSLGAKKVANDERLVGFVEGFMERNDIGVVTISYVDSDDLWPSILKNNALKKIEKAPDATLVAGILFFPEESIDGETRNFTARLLLEGKTNEVYDLLNISGEDMALISEDTSDELIGNQSFSKPKEAQDKVVNAMIAALQKVEQIADPTSPTGQVVTFRKKGNQKHGFDLQTYDQLQSDYPTIVVGGESYLTAWKSLKATQPDEVIAIDTSGQEVTFELDGIPVNGALTDGRYTLSLQGSSDGTEGELLAKVGETTVGKLNTVSYSISSIDLKIVPVNGAGSDISQAALQRELDSIYAPAVASWNVQVLDNQELGNAWDADGNGLDDGETGSFTNYTDEMNDLIKEFKRQNDRDKDAYYIFLVDRAENASKLGYMPRKKQWGFVFTNGQSTEALTKTIAHELGHGVYRLEHPFSEKGLPKGQTDNLMDYSSGKELYKYQWDYVHDPASVVTLFDDEEEGAMSKDFGDYLTEILNLYWCAKANSSDYFKYYGFNRAINNHSVPWSSDLLDLVKLIRNTGSLGVYDYSTSIENDVYQSGNGRSMLTYYTLDFPRLNSDETLELCFSSESDRDKFRTDVLNSPDENWNYHYSKLSENLQTAVESNNPEEILAILLNLPPCGFEQLNSALRVQLISKLLNEPWTDGVEEVIILKLINEIAEVNTLAEEMKSINWTSFYSSIDDEQSETLTILLINLAQQYHAGRELTPIGHVNYEAFKVYDFVNRYSLKQESDKVGISIQTTIPGGYMQPPYQSTKEVLALSDPFDVVTLSTSANTSTEGLPTIPVALVYKMIHQQESERIIDQAWLTLDVATMLLGVGEISLAIKSPQIVAKVTRILLGAADLTATATDIYCNSEVDSELCEEWREWGVYIQLGLIGASGFDQIKSLLGRSDDFVIYLNKLDGYENLRNLRDRRIINKLENWTDDQLNLLDSDLASSSLRTSFMNDPDLVDSWAIIKNSGDDDLAKLATNLDELDLVSKNLDDVSKFGGYKEWSRILRGAVKSGDELVYRLSKIDAPKPEIYKGDFYRTVGNGRDPLITHYIPRGTPQRYAKPGEDALFFGSSKEGNFQELAHWDVKVEGNTTTFVYKEVQSTNLLDLTNPTVRDKFGISLDQITNNSYEFTDVIGTWTRDKKYSGIIYPSARGTVDNKYFVNIAIFDSGTANQIIKGKRIEKIMN